MATNRIAANPLQIDIVTNVVLPIEVDEVATWDDIQPTVAQIMRVRGAVPLNYADMATAYPDLFLSRDAAKMALARERMAAAAGNPEQTPIGEYLIGVCSGFSSLRYRRVAARGPASTLLYDHTRIDPQPWLSERVGEVALFQQLLNQ